MTKKKIKKEPDAIDKVVDYFLENIDNPQDLFKGNTIFQEFTKKLTERMLNTEIKDYLETDENHNKRNGNTQKTIITKNGSIAIDVPRDRNSTFEPVIIPKRQRRFDNFDQKVISLYARGMTISDIKAQLQEFYHGAEISESLISQITDDVIEEVKMWQTKPLEKIYPIVYFDCIVVKVKQDKRIINKAVYLALGINLDGLKDILGMWISENEGAKFWLNNLTEMKNRGLQDILVACSDNLTGMSDAIEAVFPKTQHQLCIVHQIRNSLKFVPYKDRKLVANDLKSIYTAINEEIALIALDHFSEKWNKKYPQITKSWKNNWNNLIIFLEYPQEFRRIIYTTNAIESVNSQLRKVIKNKKIFPNDASVFKIFYLAFQNMVKKWTMPIRACPKFCVSIIHSELYLKEGEQKMTKKIKKEPDAIDKVVDYFLENIDNPQDLFKGNTIFQEFTKKLTERMLNTEIKDYLETDENHNKRNGNTQKTIITKNGSIAIDVPRDRNSTFEPVIIPKRQRRFDNFDQKVISLYARGMTISDIKAQLQEFYHGAEISESLISQITDDVIEEVKMWQTKPLEKIYPIVYFDCIVVKVKQDKRIINKAVYLALGINLDGLKDILGMWISENEGAKFWLNNLTEMKNRGLQDILVACSDNLTGMSDAIEAVFPKTQHQLCIVHQIRNSLKFVPYKDRKLVANDLKSIYTAINEEIALIALDHFSEKWNKKYPQITKSWKNNWNNLIIFLEYPQEFRRIIYTTNAIESVNSQLRKVIKNKKIFPNDASVFKIFYLAFQNMVKKWTMPIQNWGSAISHLMIKFEDRVNLS